MVFLSSLPEDERKAALEERKRSRLVYIKRSGQRPELVIFNDPNVETITEAKE